MANKLFNADKPVKHVGRNGFDLSSSHCFGMRPGIVRPVFFQSTCPDSSFKINVSDLVRADDLQTAAFIRGKQELDVFFLPYRLLYASFDKIVFGRGENNNPLELSLNSTSLPTVKLSILYEHAITPYVLGLFYRQYILAKLSQNATPIFYQQDFEDIVNAYWRAIKEDSVTTTQAQQDFLLRLMFLDSVSLVGLDQNISVLDLHPVGASAIQYLSSLGYGDVYQVVMNYYSQFTAGIDFSDIDDVAGACGNMFSKLHNTLFAHNVEDPIYVNVLNLCAFQKIWCDYYRDSVNDEDTNYVNSISCNFASATWNNNFAVSLESLLNGITTSLIQTRLNYCIAYQYLRPRLRQYKKDLSCGIYSSTQFGNVGTTEDFMDIPHFATGDGAIPTQGSSGPNGAYAIKFALAIQKYRETLMRAGDRAKDLLMSEFGVKSRYIDDHYPHYLGSFSGILDLNKISATADTGEYSVGQLSGNIFSSLQGKTIDFTCNDYGVIVGVMSFVPEMFHSAFGLSPMNLKIQQFDFYHSDFENMGLQPVSSQLFDVVTSEGAGVVDTLGFGPRYNEYKQNLDLVHDTFVGSAPVDEVLAAAGGHRVTEAYNFGVDSNYVTIKPISQTLSNLKERSYMLPDCMDTIFKSLDDGTAENCHFKVGMDVQINAVLPMSVMGMM